MLISKLKSKITKNLLINIISFFLKLLFKQELTYDIKKFIKDLGFLTFATFTSSLFTFIINLIMVRKLGPIEYGYFSIIQVISNILIIPMLFGINTAMVRRLAIDKENKNTIIKTSFSIILINTIFILIIAYLFSNKLTQLFNVKEDIFFLSIYFAIATVIFSLAQDILRGLNIIDKLSIATILMSIVILLFISYFLFIKRNYTLYTPFYSNLYSLLFFSILAMILSKLDIKGKFSIFYAREFLKYGIFFVCGALSGMLINNINRLFINKFLGIREVGIYSAYFNASNVVIGRLLSVFITIYFPFIAKKGIDNLFKKLTLRTNILIFIIIFLLSFSSMVIVIYFYGKKYEFNLLLIFLFSILEGLIFISSILGFGIISIGIKGIKMNAIVVLIVGIISVILNINLIKFISLYGAIIAQCISVGGLIYLYSLILKRMLS